MPFVAEDDAAGGEIRAFDELHEFFQADVVEIFPVVQQEDDGVGNLAQVVGRNVGGHADGNTARAVDQQIGQHRRQHCRLEQAIVEIAVPVHRIHLDVLEHELGDATPGAPRYNAWPPGCRRRPTQSCPDRPPADSAG